MVWRIVLTVLLAASTGCTRDPALGASDGAAPTSTHSSSIVRLAATPTPASRPSAQGFASARDRGDLVTYPGAAAVRRDGAYTWYRGDISEAHALAALRSGRLQVTTPSGETLQMAYRRHVEHPNGDWTWVGTALDGTPGEETILTFGEKAVFGSIAQPGKPPLRLTIRDGVSWLVETDPTRIAGIINAATRPTAPDYLIAPKLRAPRAGADAPVPMSIGTAAAASAESATGTAATTVDIVLGYTSGFASALGGPSQANTRLNFLVDVANQAYLNSQVDAQLRLVHTVQVSYPDATSNSTALEELTGFQAPSTKTTPAAAFAELRAARDQYGADLVSLVRKFNDPENAGCGIAWMIGAAQSGIDQTDEFFGYSVVSDGTDAGTDGKTYFCRDETLAHEAGHNMGSAHDVETIKQVGGDKDGVLDANEYGLFPYSFGFKTAVGTGNFYTVMAYGDSGQTRYRTFSNPRTTFCGGFPCGSAEADNARSLSQSMPTVASFRASVVPVNPPLTSRARGDVDGDGRSDLLLENPGFSLSAYWVMNGATPVRYSTAMGQPAGYTRVATGDFNGDGKLDIVWARPADRSLLLWQGDGNGFIQYAVRTYSEGWSVTGAGDVDGDGKSDLLLANLSSGLFAYWIMNGPTPVRYSVAFVPPTGYTQVATGDFNGDGKIDIVWALKSMRQLLMWRGDGNGFTATSIRDYSAGWSVTGAGDIDGDGKSDLLLGNAATGQFAYWIMSSVVPLRYSSAFSPPAGYTRASAGDFNGDGKLDLVWGRSADRSLLLWLGDGFGFAPAPIGNYAAGWQVVRDEVVADTAVTSRTPPRGDVDGDGRSDFILQHPGSRALAYWVMNGATPIRYSSVIPNQPAPVTTGDFNGDGNLDLVMSYSTNDVVILVGDGAGFTQRTSGYTRSPGWVVTGSGDVDGDGQDDLVLANPSAGLFAYWLMNDGQLLRSSDAMVQPAGYAHVATGDFNGDGLLDVVWARASDRTLILWQGNGTGFLQAAIRDYAPGWAVTGAGDADGDGKTDLLLANAGQGLTAYWVMDGALPVRYSVAFNQPAGYVRVATGDYNGDGKLDLVWVRSADRHVLMWLGDGNGFMAAPVGNHSEGWLILQP